MAIVPGPGMLHYDDARALVWLAKGGKQAPARWCSFTVDAGRGAYRWSGVRGGVPWTLTAEATLWTFPPYRQVIPDPKGATDRCTVRRAELVRALKIAAGDLGGKLERVFLRVRGDGLTLEAENVV